MNKFQAARGVALLTSKGYTAASTYDTNAIHVSDPVHGYREDGTWGVVEYHTVILTDPMLVMRFLDVRA